uniref:Uncharacterized protein n=1 Tax=Myotis myotis TaxID=51298 RepID=A0A7J7XHP8_MYOMY|nr:hypothetical protein mMyoMyo1_011740 [Myotis myotis]
MMPSSGSRGPQQGTGENSVQRPPSTTDPGGATSHLERGIELTTQAPGDPKLAQAQTMAKRQNRALFPFSSQERPISSRGPSDSEPGGMQGPSETRPEAGCAWMGREGLKMVTRPCSMYSDCPAAP